MSMFVSKLISSAIQITLFTLVPFIWWYITARKSNSFLKWIGLKRTDNSEGHKPFLWVAGTSLIFMLASVFILCSLKDVEMAASEFSGLGAKAVPAVLIYAIFNTALPEEILFRGFLLKRIASKSGFAAGNMIQAFFFGLMHGVMFFSLTGLIRAILITCFTGIIGWLMGYVNEKKAEGSILPSWCIHSIANIFTGLSSAFGLLL